MGGVWHHASHADNSVSKPGGLPRGGFLLRGCTPTVQMPSGGFRRVSRISARAGIFPKICGFLKTWVEEGGCLYFLFNFTKPFRRLWLYKSCKYESIGSFPKPLVLCKKTVKETLEIIRVIMVRCVGQSRDCPLPLRKPSLQRERDWPDTLTFFSNRRIAKPRIGSWWL